MMGLLVEINLFFIYFAQFSGHTVNKFLTNKRMRVFPSLTVSPGRPESPSWRSLYSLIGCNYSAMSLRAVFWRSNLPFIRPA
jgi:hypothetical protein